MSVKFRVQLCQARNGGFVGDALDECCHRASIEFESLTAVQFPFVPAVNEEEQETREESGNGAEGFNALQPLPSFRDFQ